MKERPILFSGEMVRAILDGRKTQTRRTFKEQPPEGCGAIEGPQMFAPTVYVRGEEQPGPEVFGAFSEDGEWSIKCPYGQPGDRLWVRETWFQKGRYVMPAWPEAEPEDAVWSGSKTIQFPASGDNPESREDGRVIWRKRPSIHMPRWASRILLEITNVRVERLQEVSETDAKAEGVNGEQEAIDAGLSWYDKPRRAFQFLWQSINGADSWDANPWVWVVEFRVIQPREVAA